MKMRNSKQSWWLLGQPHLIKLKKELVLIGLSWHLFHIFHMTADARRMNVAKLLSNCSYDVEVCQLWSVWFRTMNECRGGGGMIKRRERGRGKGLVERNGGLHKHNAMQIQGRLQSFLPRRRSSLEATLKVAWPSCLAFANVGTGALG